MMDTILNLGINDEVVEALAKKTGNAKFAWDSYRRFLQMYGSVVMEVEAEAGEHHDPYEVILDKAKAKAEVDDDSGLKENDLREVVAAFKALIKKRSGQNFPEDPREQLKGAVTAVFNSWQNDRAIVYRQKYGILPLGERLLMFRLWSLVTPVRNPEPALLLRVTQPRVRMCFTVSI